MKKIFNMGKLKKCNTLLREVGSVGTLKDNGLDSKVKFILYVRDLYRVDPNIIDGLGGVNSVKCRTLEVKLKNKLYAVSIKGMKEKLDRAGVSYYKRGIYNEYAGSKGRTLFRDCINEAINKGCWIYVSSFKGFVKEVYCREEYLNLLWSNGLGVKFMDYHELTQADLLAVVRAEAVSRKLIHDFGKRLKRLTYEVFMENKILVDEFDRLNLSKYVFSGNHLSTKKMAAVKNISERAFKDEYNLRIGYLTVLMRDFYNMTYDEIASYFNANGVSTKQGKNFQRGSTCTYYQRYRKLFNELSERYGDLSNDFSEVINFLKDINKKEDIARVKIRDRLEKSDRRGKDLAFEFKDGFGRKVGVRTKKIEYDNLNFDIKDETLK